MKKLVENEMKAVKGGITCFQYCTIEYNACLRDGIPISVCSADRRQCRLDCQGCNPICP